MRKSEPGLRVTEHLELVRPLGRGAMGEVWVARHINLDSEVAVKFLHPGNAEDPEIRARFEVEAKAAARLKSPHVVQVFDHGVTDDGAPFLVMELLDGENLDSRLDREPQLEPDFAAEIVDQVAEALAVAHEHGIVHRDVKPGNIFLCPGDDGVFVKLLDFGVARATAFSDTKLTQSGVMIGTPSYISREMVISRGPVDHRADLWALSVMAYEMLTGDVPFVGETVGLVCIAIVTGEPIAASSRAPVPPAVDAFFTRAFALSIDARFATATELAASFRAALAGQAPEVVVAPPPRRPASILTETLPPRRSDPSLSSALPLTSLDATGTDAPSLPSEGRISTISGRGDDARAAQSPGQAEPRRRWRWALAAGLVLMLTMFFLRHELTVERPAEAFPAIAAQPASEQTPPAADAPLPATEPVPSVTPDARSIEPRQPPRWAPRPVAKPRESGPVGRDDYGF